MLISVLVSTLRSLQQLHHKAQLQQLHGLISSLLFTTLKCIQRVAQHDRSPRASCTFVRHTNILFPSIRHRVRSKFSVCALMAWSEMTNQMSALFTEREREEQKYTNHRLGNSAVYVPFISRKGMSEWDDDSSKHFLVFSLPILVLFQHFFSFIKASSQFLHPPP